MESISSSTGIRGAVDSQIGGRQENQDSCGMAETRLGLLVVVCDGMGGGPAGKLASQLAVQAIIDYVSCSEENRKPDTVLSEAVISANEILLSEISKNPSLKGMGTTCVGLLVRKEKAYVVHVGDSRCYQLRGGKVVFRTADHSYVAEMVRQGELTEEEARTSNFSNVITRAIGVNLKVEPETDTLSFKAGDRFALMTDGIWGVIPEPKLVAWLSRKADSATLVPDITDAINTVGVNEGGGHDNLTLAVVDIPAKKSTLSIGGRKGDVSNEQPVSKQEDESIISSGASKNKKTIRMSGSLVASILIICLIAGISIWLYFSGKGNSTPSTYPKSEITETQKSDAKIEKGKTNNVQLPKSDRAELVRKIDIVIKGLETLRDFDKGPKNFKKRIQIRNEIFEKNIMRPLKTIPLGNLAEEINKYKRAMVIPSKNKDVLTTKEGNEVINKFIERLNRYKAKVGK